MILLDTNVVSEAMKPAPDEAVRAWLDVEMPGPATALALAWLIFPYPLPLVTLCGPPSWLSRLPPHVHSPL